MASEREDIEMTDARNYPLPENYDRDIGETSLSNPSFEDGNTQYLIGDRSNLIDELSPAPRLTLMTQNVIFESNQDKLSYVLGGSKWAGKDRDPNLYTARGVELLSARCEFSGPFDNILHIKGENGEYIKDSYSGEIFNFLTKDFNKNFKAYKTLCGKIDSQSLSYINEILTTHDRIKDMGHHNFMSDMDRSNAFSPYRIAGVREPGAGAQQPDGVPITLTPILDRVPVTPTPIFDAVIRGMDIQAPEGFINDLIGVPEEELIAKGFTEHALGELRGLVKSGVDSAAIIRDKDMIIEEIKVRIEENHERILVLNRDLQNEIQDNLELRSDRLKERAETEEYIKLRDQENSELKKEIDKLKKEVVRYKEQLTEERKLRAVLVVNKASQWHRIKVIIRYVIMNPNMPVPLKARLKIAYKLEGLTIIFAISAITMFFTTIGLAISNALSGAAGGSGPPGPGPTPGPGPPSIPDREKEGLKKFAEWLKYLAGKSAAAIPGIIGSIVSFLLKTIGQVVGFAAEHVMIFLVLVVSSIIYGLIEGVKEIKKSRN